MTRVNNKPDLNNGSQFHDYKENAHLDFTTVEKQIRDVSAEGDTHDTLEGGSKDEKKSTDSFLVDLQRADDPGHP